MRINYHLHSRYSDGTIWPDSIAIRAASLGLESVSLTDHDSLGGTEEFAQTAKKWGLHTVAGVEIDCQAPSLNYKSELLVYYPQGNYQNTKEFLEDTARYRLSTMKNAVEMAKTVFNAPTLDFAGLVNRKRAGREHLEPETFSFNKVDVFLFLKEQGLLPGDSTYYPFKKTYFDSGLLQINAREKPSCEHVVKLASSDNGIVVVPHIGHEFDDDYDTMVREKKHLLDLLEYFKAIGVQGIELYHYRNGMRDSINNLVKECAAPLGFFFTYGSDCHGPGSGKDTIELFSGTFEGFPQG